jgi:hypothetical protein
MFWGFIMSAAFCTIAVPRWSLPKKAMIVYITTFASMYFSKVAFSERVIDVYYAFFREDVEKTFSEAESKEGEALLTLGKYIPVNYKMTDSELKLHKQRLEELRTNKGMMASRFDNVDPVSPLFARHEPQDQTVGKKSQSQ